MTDKELYELCRKYGSAALEAKRKFAGLLPEVLRRRLYERKGFASIFEFAAKLAGMSRDHVSLVLNLEKKLEDKPVLLKALVSGEVSANKLVRVTSIATVENQEDLFHVVKNFSNRAVETFVRDVKREERAVLYEDDAVLFQYDLNKQDGLNKSFISPKSLHVQTSEVGSSRLNLNKDVEEKLFEMQEKGININEFLRNAFKKREEDLDEKKREIADEQAQKLKKNEKISEELNHEQRRILITKQDQKQNSAERYIPVSVKKVIREEHGTRCSYPGCVKQATTLHHTQRFALARVHDPHFIAPLCEAHHEIAHKIDVSFARKANGKTARLCT